MTYRNSHFAFPRSWLTVLTFLGIAGSSSLALAAKLTPPAWATDPIVSPSVVENGQLKTTAPVLGSRSSKPTGGYVLNPVCRTPTGEIIVGITKYANSKWRVVCPDGGKAILNGSSYTTEDKVTTTQRGRLSAATVSFETQNGARHVLCYGKLASGQTLPGQMSIPLAGTLPTACKVRVMGQVIDLPDWGMFLHKNAGVPSGPGWWSPSVSPTTANTDLPLYTFGEFQNRILCRASDSGLKLPGKLTRAGASYQCLVFTPTGNFKAITNFELYVDSTRNGRPFINPVAKTKATQSWADGVLVYDGGDDAKRIYGCNIAGNDEMGWVKKSEGICRVNATQTATTFKLLMK